MKKHLSTILLVLILLAGLSLLLYPTFSDYWNSMHQSRAIADYTATVANMNEKDYTDIWEAAWDYNAKVPERRNRFYFTDEDRAEYNALLNVSGNGIMGYIEIPKIDCRLPIYHGTAESVLQIAVGHIEGSSLPVGGAGSHCVLSGHRGLPSAKLFTNLDKITVGDEFMMHVLNETLTYQVDQILTVLPEDISGLAIDPEQDYCTLITCTPYGINSHRLLVRGHRVETAKEVAPIHVTADAMAINHWAVAVVVGILLLFVQMYIWIVQTRKR